MRKKAMHSFILMAAMTISVATAPLHAYASGIKGWEPVKTERSDARSVIKESEIEIKSASGVIFVSTTHPVQIKIFTILGRLVSSETVAAGKSQFQLPAHGIYVVKAGDFTCKVAV